MMVEVRGVLRAGPGLDDDDVVEPAVGVVVRILCVHVGARFGRVAGPRRPVGGVVPVT
jgi:hypothetical protein